MKKLSLLFIAILALVLVLSACTTPAEPEVVEVTRVVTETITEEVTRIVEGEVITEQVEVTRIVEVPAEEEAPAPITLTYLVDDGETDQLLVHTFADAYMELHPNVTIEIENRPQGGDGDNVVKTRLATGEMTDVFFYNAGSLLQALNPSDTLVDLTNEPFMANVDDAFKQTVAQNGKVFGVPSQSSMGGGILYNKKVYEDLGLSVPLTWDEFAANNEIIKEAGIAPVIATFGDTWTSQLFVLADYYNVQAANPNFAEEFTANEAKYATTPAALAGFKYVQEGYDKGWYQQDFATATFNQGLEMLANGEGAHYPMLSFALPTIATNWPDKVNDIGFFAQPGPDASSNGATIWMLSANYIPLTTTGEKLEVAKDFLAFTVSPEAIAALNEYAPPSGPYLVKGAELPDDVLPAVLDIKAYIDSGNSAPALEFLSPVKGPNLEHLLVAVGTGQMTAEEAAAAYDEDVKQQAQQLGLPGW
ncbi:MAG: extracellular solute-binding protein [Ardenticatenaceae bacterium]|nr:extracellular solute-binding protein [Ardenticatenaceae bacterium]MCB9446555.1 extracellular solute-binding protein [Ardenticatenaceae bacterium]